MSLHTLLKRVFVLKRADFAGRATPPRALYLSLLALLVAGGAALFRPRALTTELGLLWVLALIPCFLFSYYRGMRGAALALVLGMVAITASEVLGGVVFGQQMDWWIYASASCVLIVVSLGAGVTTELLQRASGDPYLATDRWQTGRELKRALAEDGLIVHYQPVVNLESDEVRGAEALVRWQHPEHGLLAPDQFLPTAEATDLIVPLGEWVLHRALSELDRCRKSWEAAGDFFVSVNLSAAECRDPDALQRRVQDALLAHDADPQTLQIEITETDVLEAAEAIAALKELGTVVVIDDFGTEYGALNYLRWLKPNGMKIDPGLVDSLMVDPRDATIAEATIELGKRLGMQVTAEGVESRNQLETLRVLECDLGQGFHFGEPGPLPRAATTSTRTRRKAPAASGA